MAALVLPVLKPKAYLPVHWDGLFGAFKAGPAQPYADPELAPLLASSGVRRIVPVQYMDKWRLDRTWNSAARQLGGQAEAGVQLMRVAFLGLGKHGRRHGRRACSRPAIRWRCTTARRRAPRHFAKLGARIAESPRAAAQKADVIIGMTADDESSRAMWLGDQRCAGGRQRRPMHSPSSVRRSRMTGCSNSRDCVRDAAFRYVDAPVTGLPDAAAAGTLTLLVGADAADLDAARPIFTSLATRVLHFGAVGQGTVYKLMINLIGAVQIASAAEGVVLAERAGLDLKLVADAVASGQAASPQVVRNVRRFVAGDHATNVNFTPALRLKDIEYALRLANKLGVDCPFGKCCRGALPQALRAAALARDNESRIIDALRS